MFIRASVAYVSQNKTALEPPKIQTATLLDIYKELVSANELVLCNSFFIEATQR